MDFAASVPPIIPHKNLFSSHFKREEVERLIGRRSCNFAGTDTESSTMSWAFYDIAVNTAGSNFRAVMSAKVLNCKVLISDVKQSDIGTVYIDNLNFTRFQLISGCDVLPIAHSRSEQAQFQPTRLTQTVHIPGRIPDQFELNITNPVNGFCGVFNFTRKSLSDWAVWRR